MSSLSSWGQRVADAVARTMGQRRRLPVATYRLQFERDKLTFRDVAGLVPYLDELGITHLYASPCLKTRSGSPHGYAVVDYGQLNPELGNADDYHAMVDALHGHGMGHILDVVPNHMSATTENAWWRDILENGPGSPYAAHFDIDWRPLKEELQDKLLLPILGEQYGKVLESGELKLEYLDGAFFIRYYEMALPVEPRSYRSILAHRLEEFKQPLPPDSEELRELESILTSLEHLPDYTETDPARIAERQREKEVVKSRIRNLAGRCEAVAEFIGRNVAELNGSPDDPRSFGRLDQLLDAQPYRLSHWKAAADEINYRRFFDVNELAAVCMEDPKVFAESHRLVFELLVRGDVDGLRIDHIDGLYDPTEYLRRLQWGYLRALGRAIYEGMAGAEESEAGSEQEGTERAGEQGRRGEGDPNVSPLYRPAARLPRGGPPIEAPHSAGGGFQRPAVAGPPAKPHLGTAPANSGLHAPQPADGAIGDSGLLSGVSNVYP